MSDIRPGVLLAHRGDKKRDLRLSVSQRRSFLPGGILIVIALLFVGCSLFGDTGDSTGQAKNDHTNAVTPTAQAVALNKLSWCNNKSSIVFTDGSAATTPTAVGSTTPTPPTNLGPANGTPVSVKDWNTFKANLGFTVYLPETLPAGSCLLSASGTIRNAVMGSNFVLTYMLPDNDALAISQAPQHTQNKALQCSVSDTTSSTSAAATPTPTSTSSSLPLQVCSGVRDTTNITFSARWKVADLQTFFANLKVNVTWEPAS